MVATASQKRHGRAKGSQGYSSADCIALVAAVKEILPLGSQDWANVLTRYNEYADANNRVNRDVDPLKIKFRALVNHSKPTGDPDCPSYVREAKATQIAMDKRAEILACSDSASNEEESVILLLFFIKKFKMKVLIFYLIAMETGPMSVCRLMRNQLLQKTNLL